MMGGKIRRRTRCAPLSGFCHFLAAAGLLCTANVQIVFTLRGFLTLQRFNSSTFLIAAVPRCTTIVQNVRKPRGFFAVSPSHLIAGCAAL
jgi:hypothetical protein